MAKRKARSSRRYMIGRAHEDATGHVIGWLPEVLRTRRLKLLTMCGRNLIMAYYEESAELVGVCSDCRARAQRDAKRLDNGE